MSVSLSLSSRNNLQQFRCRLLTIASRFYQESCHANKTESSVGRVHQGLLHHVHIRQGRSGCNLLPTLESNSTTNCHHNQRRCFSEWKTGTDLLADSLAFGERPKVVFEGYAPTGFDVSGMIEKVDKEEQEKSSGMLHMDGSILAFPNSCFLWDVPDASQVTLESLSPVLLVRPSLQYLFIGCNAAIPREQLLHIQAEFKKRGGIIVEHLDLANAMGTFNILNGEDRRVAVALVVEREGT